MEATDKMGIVQTSGQLEMLSRLFGSYKAEWLQDSLFDLYTEPSYFPELTTARPCVLNGGRGTGKTTVLRSLSYLGQWEILKRRPDVSNSQDLTRLFESLGYVGFYYRVNTPRVTAFQGIVLDNDSWQRLFTHYLNLLFSLQIAKFLLWYRSNVSSTFALPPEVMASMCLILGVGAVSEAKDFENRITLALLEMESYINNVDIDERPRLSPAGALDSIFSLLATVPEFKGKTFFLIIDEYENFRDEQQQMVNTLIKHTSSSYTFKIGVKKLGWRVRNTSNPNENLISPADYVLIDIADKITPSEFNKFAEKVCNSRITKLLEGQSETLVTVRDLFPELALDEEATLLGIQNHTNVARKTLERDASAEVTSFVHDIKDLDLYCLMYWAEGDNVSLETVLLDYKRHPELWKMRIEEYKYASLFTIRNKVPGIKKFYSGWDVFCRLSATNIRYLLELVEQTLVLELKKRGKIGSAIAPEVQTSAAEAVGKRNLQELDGLSTYGAKLTKLVLGLGRIFGELAEDSAGHAIEVNQFRVKTSKVEIDPTSAEWLLTSESLASKILNAAIMHQAIIPFPGNKPKDEGETKDSTFQLHPIFAAYFIFSHRKRRNLVLEESQITGLIDNPRSTIKAVLAANNRLQEGDLPE